ncbi:DegV family protein [Mizugakiibacter sediminis]|uniref:DegV family protein n=1 Tax=Mizugakiibacter sediminis TaxID=1475481 RepID=A0A0K8QP96_9GAMM|nr:DegV family protein [Mizugakiibacter sediminis]GAP66232.1 DegV family protein [Mizugakiibacter sediminis]
MHATVIPASIAGGASLRRALAAGIRRVTERREHLDRINVFPVPDGDTGSNLAFTLGAVQRGLQRRRARGAAGLLRLAAEAAVDGARGNSGAILAQFLCGASAGVGDASRLTAPLLARAVALGAEQARGAVAEPREGTILSVIAAFAQALREQAAEGRDLRTAFAQALEAARAALSRTPQQLPALRRAGVVDAGAQGFVELLEGIADFLREGRRVRVADAAYAGEAGAIARAGDGDDRHRYCVECVVSGEALPREAIMRTLRALDGGSLVLAGTPARLRVHMHLDAPQRLYDALAAFGAVSAQKADDMHAQQHAAGTATRVAIVVDSAADLPDAEIERHGIGVVPVRVGLGARDYLDKVAMSNAELYRRMRESPEPPRTSQPPPGDFRRLFEVLLSHHRELVYVGISRALSGTFQAAESAARACGGRVHLFDSATASCGQGLYALLAAEQAARGADAAAVLAALEAARGRVRTYALVRELDHAVRGGRIPAWSLPLTRWLKLAPLLQARGDGRLRFAGATFGACAPERFAAWVAKRARGVSRALVGHCDNRAEAERLAAALQRLLALAETPAIVEVGAAIGAHAGPGTLVVGVVAGGG